MNKPYYRKAADWWEFRDIMDEHGEGDMVDLLTRVLEGKASPADVLKAQCEIVVWNDSIDEREAEEAS